MNDVIHKREVTSPTPAGRQMWRTWFDPAEPHLARGPFTLWPVAADSALSVVVFVTSVIAVAASALDDGEEFTVTSITDLPTAGFALLALAAAALLWRRRRPVLVTVFVLAIIIIWAVAGYGDGQDLALVVAIYSVGRYTADHRTSLATVAVATAIDMFGTIIDSDQRIDIAPAIILTVLPWYVGRRIRNRGDYVALLKERADRLEAEQQARARQAVADERSRIARELHDVVAHRVSMMTVQAGAAKTIARDDLDAAINAMGDVERGGRQALGELRHLLSVLRPDTTDSDDLGPQPGLADIKSLADDLTHTGAAVTLTIADLPSALPVAVDLSAYRIVQECCTNIIKHAGPNPTVDVVVGLDDRDLVIDITNGTARTTVTTDPGLPASGYGIVGMRERAQLLGGTLVAEPQTPDRFRVHARLPIEPEPT
jgi:signal transduction histidine kinase